MNDLHDRTIASDTPPVRQEDQRALHPVFDIAGTLPAIALSFGISFFRDVQIAARLGDSSLANAYAIAASIQASIGGLITGTVNACVPPAYAKHPNQQKALLRAALQKSLMASLVASFACLALTSLLLLTRLGGHLRMLDLAFGSVLFCAAIPLLGCAAVAGVRLNSDRRLVISSLPTIGGALGIVIAARLTSPSLIHLGFGVLIGIGAGLCISGGLVLLARYAKAQERPDPNLLRAAFRHVPDTAVALILACATSFSDSVLLALLAPNSVATYAYASRIPVGIQAIVSAIASARIIHIFSGSLRQRGIAYTFRQCLILYTLIIAGAICVAAILSFGSLDIIRIVFKHGQFGSQLARTVAHVHSILVWYLPAALATQVLNQFVWVMARNRALMWITAGMLFLKITIGSVATDFFGVVGIAWSQVLVYWITAVLVLALAIACSKHPELKDAVATS